MSNEPSDQNEQQDAAAGKGRPTPTRREREAANLRPLVGNSRSENKERLRAQREKARQGMMAGEERYLPARDKGPQRGYVRDLVDSRFSIGEVLIPVMIFVLVVSMFLQNVGTQLLVTLFLWGFILITLTDGLLMNMRIGKKLRAKFGENHVEKGWRFYAFMRAMQFRAARVPKPKKRIGGEPVKAK